MPTMTASFVLVVGIGLVPCTDLTPVNSTDVEGTVTISG
jgi:hypothetical protein